MKTNLPISLLSCVIFILVHAPPPVAAEAPNDQGAEQRVTVELLSGRTFTTEIDPRTDQTRLWIRHDIESGYLLRAIDWDRVVGVEILGEHLSGDELRSVVCELRRLFPARAESDTVPSRIVLSHTESPPYSSPAPVPPKSAGRVTQPKVRSLAVEARIGNWDGDVEADGLILDVYPLDATGEVVPIRGTLQVDLTAERTGVVKRRQPFAQLGRWAERVSPEDFDTYGARYRLPFQSAHPEFDLDWSPYGAVHARLSVPGQGVFESTEAMVRIRAYSAVRDQLQLTTGRRFFDVERTGRGSR